MTLKKILRFAVMGSIFLVPFVPLVVSGGLFFPFISGKNFLFRVLVEIAVVAWIALALRDIEYRPKKSLLLYVFAAFVAIIAIADALALNSGKAFWSNFERMEGWVTLAHLFAYFVVLGSVFKDEKMWNRLFHTSLGVATIISLYGIGQLAGFFTINQGGVRLDATLGNATYLAVYMIFHVFFALLYFVRSVPRLWKAIGYGVLAFLFMFILFNTATRGAAVGLVAGLIIASLLIAIFGKKERFVRKGAFVFLGIIVLVIIGFFSLKNTETIKNHHILGRLASISIEDFTTSARAMVWPMALEGFKEKPIFGWGQENFNYVFNKHYVPGMYGQEQWFDRTHNVILDWLIAGGILGLLSYLLLYGSGIYILWKKSNLSFIERSVFTGLLSAYFIHNLFVFDNITSYILFVTVLAYFHSHAGVPSVRLARIDTETSDEMLSRYILPIGLIVLAFVLYTLNYKAYAQGGSLINALRALGTNPKDPKVVLASFEKSLSYDALGQSEVRERLVEAVSSMNNANVPIAERQAFFDLGAKELGLQLEETPEDARYYLFAGNFYLQYGQSDKAIEFTEKALSLSPDKQSILYQLGNMYFTNNEPAKALSAFKKAYELDKTNVDALRYYAAGAIYTGDTVLGEKIIKDHFGTTVIPDTMLAQIYIDTKQWNKAVLVWEALIKSDPENIDYYIKRAGTLLQADRRQEAIQAIREIIAKKPEFKDQGEFYIKEIEAGRNP